VDVMSELHNMKIIDNYGWLTECTPMDELRVISPVRLVGSTFQSATASVDPYFWTATIAASGGTVATCVQGSGKVILSSKTDATGSVILQSYRTARYIGGSSNRFRGQVQLGDTGVANNTKRWGMFDGTNGAYFKLAGTAMSVNTMKASSETSIASASWNGSTTVPTLTNCNVYEIYVTNSKVYFVINGTLVHTENTNNRAGAANDTWSATLNLPCRADNINSTNTTDTTMSIRVMSIYRLGELATNTRSAFLAANATTTIKDGAGRINHILNCDNAGTLSVYDGLSAAGTLLSTIDCAKVLGNLSFGIPFHAGLTLVVGGGAKVMVVYE
jgi:hypothetical protein